MNQIYLDYAATTPVDPIVARAMAECLTMGGVFGNPSSNTHYYGYAAQKLVDEAKIKIADLLNADPREIIFTSGATESSNLAIKGVADAYLNKGNHIITSLIEHKATLDTCKYLESKGYQVSYLKPNQNGMHSIDQIKEILTDKTILISLMYVNNELGNIQPISEIGEFCRQNKILFHVDGAQAVGKLSVDVIEDKIDLLSVSGHKMYGPKGIGVLYVRRKPKVKLTPLIHGGGHQQGYRSGTLATHQIVGLGEAAGLAKSEMERNFQNITGLREKLVSKLLEIPKVFINVESDKCYPGIVNIRFSGVDGEALLMALNRLAISSGSACNSTHYQASHVLRNIGLTDQEADQSLRISIGKYTTDSEINIAIEEIVKHVNRLRQLSPKHQTFSL